MGFSATELTSFAEQWDVVQRFCSSSHRTWVGPAGAISETPPESFFNLPVVLAFSLLDEVLDSLMAQGAFPPPRGHRPMLGPKMAASRAHLPWQDYIRVERGKDQRNALAHQGVLISNADCLAIVDAIGVELVAWGAIA